MFRTIYESVADSEVPHQSKKVKRYRSAFTTGQINYLEKQFKKCPYIGSTNRKEVATVLNIPERAIKIWFQNRRMKEKKEGLHIEHNILDHQNNIRNNIDVAKNSLNNVHSSQSANDQQRSLQSTVSKQANKIHGVHYNNEVHSKFFNQMKMENLTKQSSNYITSPLLRNTEKNNDTKQTIVTSPANLLECNLSKVNSDKKFNKCLEKNKKGETKRKVIPKSSNSMKSLPEVSFMHKVIPGYQDMPEDLSASRIPNAMIPQNHYGNINLNSTYVPFYNAENVCLSAGNVIWKPVNVMSVVSPNSSSIAGLEMQSHEMYEKNIQKCKCTCNGTTRNRLNNQQRIITPQPQYVIAIPYNTNTNIF